MRTTLDLPDPLFREVKIRAVQQGVTLKDLLAQYIQAGTDAPASTMAPAHRLEKEDLVCSPRMAWVGLIKI